MFLKYDPYRVWCSILYSKLINCILFKMIMQHVRFVKGRGTFQSRERNVIFFYRFSEVPQILLLRIDRNLCSVHLKEPQSGCTHPCVSCYAGYTVCTTWLRLFLYEPNKYCDQSLIVLSIRWVNHFVGVCFVYKTCGLFCMSMCCLQDVWVVVYE